MTFASYNWIEIAIIIFIISVLVYLVWRGGQANPESTGAVGKRLNRIDGDVKSVKNKVDHIDGRMDDVVKNSACVADIRRLEEKIAALPSDADVKTLGGEIKGIRREMDLMSKASDKTGEAVVRIEQHLLRGK